MEVPASTKAAAAAAVEEKTIQSKGKSGGGRQISIASVATPSRGGRNGDSGADRARGPASALEDLMRRKGVDEAWSALETMQKQGASTDKYTVSRMLMKTVGDGRSRLNPTRVYRGIALVEKFIETQPKDVDEVLFNALLDTCCRLKDLSRVESTVARMRELDVAPSPVTLGILVKTYGQAGDLQKVLKVWDEMEKQREQANAVTYGCMIDACVKCGNLEKAVEIFKGMKDAGKHRNTILYTTLIKGYGLEKNLTQAMELFHEMLQEGVPYNTITYNSILDVCVKCGDLAAAEGLLNDMLAADCSLEPDLITFSTLLKGYCHVGDLDKALQMAETVKARGLRCDELVYNTLMDGCVKANDITAGVGLFEEMIQNGMRPSAITHSILGRLYQRAGYEDAPAAVTQLYQHHGIERPSGGDRGKGSSQPRGFRSPSGSSRAGANSSNPSPLGSPSARSVASGFGRADSDVGWSLTWGTMPVMPGLECLSAEPSAPSTPCGSPLASPSSRGGAGLCLPAEAFRSALVPPLPGLCLPSDALRSAFVPPLPGAGGETPYGLMSCSPTGGSLEAAAALAAMTGATYTPQQTPPWPLGCTAPYPGGLLPAGPMPGSPVGGDASLHQVPQLLAVSVMQTSPGNSPMAVAAGTAPSFGMMGAPCGGGDGAVCIPQQGQQMPCATLAVGSPTGAPMQGSFFMPMPALPQQAACFESWAQLQQQHHQHQLQQQHHMYHMQQVQPQPQTGPAFGMN